jgi:hypothetical protein
MDACREQPIAIGLTNGSRLLEQKDIKCITVVFRLNTTYIFGCCVVHQLPSEPGKWFRYTQVLNANKRKAILIKGRHVTVLVLIEPLSLQLIGDQC